MEAISATFRDGVFTPTHPIDLPEGSRVTLLVQSEHELHEHMTENDRQFFTKLANDRKAVFQKLAE